MIRKLLFTESKKHLLALPWVICVMIVLSIFMGVAACSVIYVFVPKEHDYTGTVALVTDDAKDPHLNEILDFISNEDTLSTLLSFEFMDKEEAEKALANHDAIAVCYFPPDMMNTFFSGQSTDINVRFSDVEDLSTVYVAETARAFVRLLTAAQAGDYTTADLFYALDKRSDLNAAYERVDLINLSFILERRSTFQFESAATPRLYFVASGIILLIFYLPVGFSPAMKRESSAYYALSDCLHGSLLPGLFARWLTHFLFIFAFLFPILVLQPYPTAKSAEGILFLVLTAMIISSFSLLLYQAGKDAPATILMYFLISTLMHLCCGGIIPPPFVPLFLRRIGDIFPNGRLIRSLYSVLIGEEANLLNLTVYALLWTILFFAGSALILRLRKKGGKL